MNRLFVSFSLRLAILYAALLTLSVALVLALTYLFTVAIPVADVKGAIRREAAVLDAERRRTTDEGFVARLRAMANDSGAARQAFHAYVAADGTILSTNLPSWPAGGHARWLSLEADRYAGGDETDHQALVLDRRFPDGRRLLTGRDIEDIDDNEEVLQTIGWWLLAGTAVLALTGGMLISRAIGRRLDDIMQTAQQVMAGNLDGRVRLRGNGDDFDTLGSALNLMLDRVTRLVESLERVSDHVAHELRTPLTRMRATLESATSAPVELQPQLISAAHEEAFRLTVVFDTVMRIARIESGRAIFESQPVRMEELVGDACELFEPGCDEKRVTLSLNVEHALVVDCDRDAMFQLLVNLLDNSVRHVFPDGRINVSANRGIDGFKLTVEDDGPGVPNADLPRLTERFYRVSQSQTSRANEGAGLGLSLADTIARQHGGTLAVGNRTGGGLRVDVYLPN